MVAQSDVGLFSRVKIFLTENQTLQTLSQLGLDTDHGQYAPLRFFINDFDQREIQAIEQAGFSFEIVIPDVKAHYLNPNRGEIAARGPEDCGQAIVPGEHYQSPENFNLGSMAGFYTYQEMLDNLDAMRTLYPNLISARAPIPGANTIEDRPIYWLRISDQPEIEENDEPEVLYTAVHHAREPNSMTQLIFYMWYLLENYATDPEVQFLVDHTALYFIPCVNPDGYIFNQTTDPQGGGLWRKNRRLNSDGSYGVDLNRNYGHEWGYDNIGSSVNPQSAVYRGSGPFSEPETKAVRDFCQAHEFEIALNYHTYGNLLIYPWGYSDTPTAEADVFQGMANAMIVDNNFVAGTGTQTVGYVTNGDADDWMYGAESIYAMTPEVGRGGDLGGFWPITEDIENNCKGTMLMNLTAANLVHNYGLLQEKNPAVLANTTGQFVYQLERIGLKAGSLNVSLTPISSNIIYAGPSQNYNLNQNEQIENSIDYTLAADIQDGEEVTFLLSIDNGIYLRSDTIRKLYDTQTPIFYDPVATANDDLWQTEISTWGTTDMDYYSPSLSYTDSPFGPYQTNAYNFLTLSEPIELGDFQRVLLNFWAKWEIEAGFDYAQVFISVNDGENIPLCGKYSVTGNEFQDEGNPVYDGKKSDWVAEEIDLSDLVQPGDFFRLSFLMAADGGVEQDGFYFDDLTVRIFQELPNSTDEENGRNTILSQNNPNPARTYTNITVNTQGLDFQQGNLVITNALGQPIYRTSIGAGTLQNLNIPTVNWPSGFYFYQLQIDDMVLPTRKMMVGRE
ncbi:MAG: hypothetical protein DHS20C18_55390 [Saprospiraceae bacterium]|nr:MAG: hypothetical protein DHS20C18_55390 [Saprospiraceae bacterium]